MILSFLIKYVYKTVEEDRYQQSHYNFESCDTSAKGENVLNEMVARFERRDLAENGRRLSLDYVCAYMKFQSQIFVNPSSSLM